MIKIIDIVFISSDMTESDIENAIKTRKQYTFKLKNTYANIVKVGDIIEDPNYNGLMYVASMGIDTWELSNLKYITIRALNGKPIPSSTKTLEVSLEEAKKWHNEDNSTLKRLALKLFSLKDLLPTFTEMSKEVRKDSVCINIPCEKVKITKTIARIEIVARYYNKDWEKTADNIGYFITYKEINGTFQLSVSSHAREIQPGTVYFKNEEDAIVTLYMFSNCLR